MIKNSFLKISAISFACIFIFSSCASLFSKSVYPVHIDSSPSNAKISITDYTGRQVYAGNTPAVVRLKAGAGYLKRAEYQVKISKSGYDDRIILLESQIDGWYFGNLFLGGIVGMLVIDPLTGAMWSIETRTIYENLGKTTVSTEPGLRIIDINDVPEDLKPHMVKVEQ